MDKTALITLIGDCISAIDIQRGSLSRGTQERIRLDEKRDTLDKLQLRLVDAVFNEGTAGYKAATDKLITINDQVKATIKNVNKIAETLASLEQLATVVDELLNLALPNIGSLSAIAIDAGAAFARRRIVSFDESEKVVNPQGEVLESAVMRSESSVVEKTPVLLIEEVLHGVELTIEKLIITVATGGCTREESFRFDVNKGAGDHQPYMVTVYRIEPDDCLMLSPPIQLSYSREELGLGGSVDFILRNKIGNTSNHRLAN